MGLTDRQNWTLSGTVGLLLLVNGLVRVPGQSGTVELLLVGVFVTGGALAAWNAATALRDPSAGEEFDWTRRKTAINVVAALLLVVALVAPVGELLGLG